MRRIGALTISSLLLLMVVAPAQAQGRGNGRGRAEGHGSSGRQESPPGWSQASPRAEEQQARAREAQEARARQRQEEARARQQQQAERERQREQAAQARQHGQLERASQREQAAQDRQQWQADRASQREQAARARQQLRFERFTRRQARLPAPAQQALVAQQQRRATRYQDRLAEQVTLARQRESWLLRHDRAAQYRNQQRYVADLLRQQAYLSGTRDYLSDPYFYTAPSYRYTLDGLVRTTNLYGYNLLRQAESFGYQEGYRAGVADQQDGAAYSYRSTFGYADANYGYYGNYVDQLDYNYFFRDAFRRGYEDGYYGGSRFDTGSYGAPSTRTMSVLGALLVAVLGLVALR